MAWPYTKNAMQAENTYGCGISITHRRMAILLLFAQCTINVFFGEIRNGIMGLSALGNEAAICLQKIPELRSEIVLDEYIVMPNHVHALLEITAGDFSWNRKNQFSKPVVGSVSIVINRYKGAVTTWASKNGYYDFCWQSKFHDHVIRDDKEYWLIKNYIINNPGHWARDKFFR